MTTYSIFIPNCQESFRVALGFEIQVKEGSVVPHYTSMHRCYMKRGHTNEEYQKEGYVDSSFSAHLSLAARAEIKKL